MTHRGGTRGVGARGAAAVLGIAVLAACGGGPDPAPDPAPVFRTTMRGDGQLRRVAEVESAERGTVAAPPERAYAAVLTVLPERFEVAVTARDTARRRAGNDAFVVKRRLAGQPATRFFDCGNDEMSEARAATWELTVSLSVQVAPGPREGTSVVSALAAATATNRGLRKPPAECTSTGQLEQQVVEQVRQAVAR